MRPRLLALTVPFLLLAIPAILLYRQVAQARLDHAFILHIKADDTAAVIDDIKHGADPNTRDSVNAGISWREVLARIFTRPPAAYHQMPSALHIALGTEKRIVGFEEGDKSGGQNVALVKALIEAGADVNAPDPNQQPPLFVAAYVSPTPIVQTLLDHHAHVNTSNAFKLTPLHMAVASKNLDAIKLLLEQGANVNAVDEGGWTPLYYAVSRKYSPVLALLIQQHADVNLHDERSVSPLQFASASNSLECIKLLKQAGARF